MLILQINREEMMLSRNETPFAAIGFGDLHRDGPRMTVIAARGNFVLSCDGLMHLSDRQRIVLSDLYEDNKQDSQLLQVTDLIPYKPFADVTFVGNAEANGEAKCSWIVGIRVGIKESLIRVWGDRNWEPTLRRLRPTWKLGDPTPVRAVPLDYRLASGGRIIGDPDGDYDDRNPIGAGILSVDHSRIGLTRRAATIDSALAPVERPFEKPEPQGFGPVPPWWSWRQRFAGTYDEIWKRDRHPERPRDFDYRFFQTAHPNLIVPRFRGNETIQLIGLGRSGMNVGFTLPNQALVAHHNWFDGRKMSARLTLDGVHIDAREWPAQVSLTWRGWIVSCPAYDSAVLALNSVAEAEDLPLSGEQGLVLPERSR